MQLRLFDLAKAYRTSFLFSKVASGGIALLLLVVLYEETYFPFSFGSYGLDDAGFMS